MNSSMYKLGFVFSCFNSFFIFFMCVFKVFLDKSMPCRANLPPLTGFEVGFGSFMVVVW